MTRLVIMQPYFIPYAGYFRLFAATDLFVVYDCVQFIRRGWIHRNTLPMVNGEKDWLTLPLAKAARAVKIKDLSFAADASDRWAEQKRRFPLLEGKTKNPLLSEVLSLKGEPLGYIEGTLRTACDVLGLPFNIVRSSSLKLPENLKGQERILAICEALGAKQYVNAPGGRALYESEAFKKRGMELFFLPEYQGSYGSILERCLTEKPEAVSGEIKSQCQLT